jgi:MYXO-CTERM domain-containing protein
LQLSLREDLRSVGAVEDSCVPCEAVAGVACTRARQGWDAVLRIDGVLPELASAYVFASVTATGTEPDTTLPTAPDWFALGSDLTWVEILPVPIAGEQVCVEVFARAVGMGQPATVGRACATGGSAPAALPASPGAGDCGPAFVARWCSDNASDCTGAGGEALPACQRYGKLCEGEDGGATPRTRDGGTVAHVDAGEADARAAGRDVQQGGVSPAGSGGCGCRTTPTPSNTPAAGAFALGLALGARIRRRKRAP